jgi:hypothetical protein
MGEDLREVSVEGGGGDLPRKNGRPKRNVQSVLEQTTNLEG